MRGLLLALLMSGAAWSVPVGRAGTVPAGLETAAARLENRTHGVSVELAVDKSLDSEEYVLDVSEQHIRVRGGSPAAVYYGVGDLGEEAPVGRRSEKPALRWRGIQLDISRGPVPTLRFLKSMVKWCAEHRLNLLGLYMEHTFAFRSHPLVGPPGGALTADEVRELVNYANQHYVVILPEQQVFGHLHEVLKHQKYENLAEIPHGHVLAPSPATMVFLRDLFAETAPLFSGPFLHIGADETVELGQGRTAEAAHEQGLGKVYLQHLTQVSEMLKPYGKRLIFWGDVAVHYPELLRIFPSDAVAMAWNYESSSGFDKLLKPFTDAGLDIMVAPGVNNWNRTPPDLSMALPNIRGFIEAGVQYHALGTLITTWNDDNESLHVLCLPALAYGAECAWRGGDVDAQSFFAAYPGGPAMLELARCHDLLRKETGGSASHSAFWIDPWSESGRLYCSKAAPAARELRLAAEHALEQFLREGNPAWAHAARRVDALGMKIQFAPRISALYREAYENQADRRRVNTNLFRIMGINGLLCDLRDSTTLLKQEYAELWAHENRPYYLDNVLVRYDLLAQQYQRRIQLLLGAQKQFQLTGTLPSPEAVDL